LKKKTKDTSYIETNENGEEMLVLEEEMKKECVRPDCRKSKENSMKIIKELEINMEQKIKLLNQA
jgi:hypothetical protein